MLRVPPAPAPTPIDSFMHCCGHPRMLGQCRVIVGTPDGNLILQTIIKGLRKVAGASLQVRKDQMSIFPSDELETRAKEVADIQHSLYRLGSARNRAGRTKVVAGCPPRLGKSCGPPLKEN